MSRQDRQGARTVTDLERKYNLGNLGVQFAEVLGIATDARKATIELEERLSNEIKAVRNEISQSTEGILLRSEFDTFKDTVTAELALKVGKDDSGEIISMINASADLIELTSNRLLIDSDFFKLSYNGVATIDSAQIDYARLTGAHIGSAYFSDNGTFATPQINFLREGIFLSEKLTPYNNRDCFVWENSDGTDMFRLYGDGNGLHIEGVEYADSVLDLTIFGMSIRAMYNKLQELTGHTHSYYKTDTTASCTSSGVATYACACGDTYTEAEEATGHSYRQGFCEYCGEANPDYECPHRNTSTTGDSTSCSTTTEIFCTDCGATIDSWTEYYHDVNELGYCRNCGEYVG